MVKIATCGSTASSMGLCDGQPIPPNSSNNSSWFFVGDALDSSAQLSCLYEE
jgi:hypothetical protein